MATLMEERSILEQLYQLGVADLEQVWQAAQSSGDPFAYLVQAYPELAAQYASTAADMAAVWYEEAPGGVPDYVPIPAELPPPDQYAGSARWALSSPGDAAFDKLAGALQGDVWDAARNTTILNAEREPGSTYARKARPGACPFCKMLATRGAVYTSAAAAGQVVGRGKDVSTNYDPITGKRKRGGQAKGVRTRREDGRKIGEKYHDNCHCQIVAVRAGESYEPPDYIQQWEQEYIAAVRASPTKGPYGAIDTKAVLSNWGKSDRAAAAAKSVVNVDEIDDLDELGKIAEKAIVDEDFDLLDKIDARETFLRDQAAAREAKNAAARERRAAATEAKRAQQDAEFDRLIEDGVDGETAIERAYGISVEQQRRENAISALRGQGYTGAGFDELTRNAYAGVVHDEWLAAENELSFLVKREFSDKVDPRELWRVNESTARKWATPELLEWWDRNGRTTLDGYRESWLGGTQALARGGDFYQ